MLYNSGSFTGFWGAELKRSPVTSSAIVSVGYDAAVRTLEIEFEGGAVYDYFDVPEAVWRRFADSDSKGGFFAAEIRERYRFARRDRRR